MTGPLRIGPYVSDTPVVLAPMAGVTNAAFRRLCREFGAGFYVNEMVTSRALVERSEKSMLMVSFDPDEYPRSLQLYGVDPATVGAAVKMVVSEGLADHIDLNFGCPVAKVTVKGGGAALPWKHGLFTQVVRAAVRAAEGSDVPVTIKMRKGLDDDHITYLDAARAAEDEGVAAIALHARTASQFYSGQADWAAIAELKSAITSVPVLGNGDIWTAEDALDMIDQTGCDGVVVGRGCLGRPWLFADLEAAFAGRPERVRPTMAEVIPIIRRHARLLVDYFDSELRGCRQMRKHVAWYLKGYAAGGELRKKLGLFETLAELDALLAQLNGDQGYPEAAEEARGRQGSPRTVRVPHGWLDTKEVDEATQRLVTAAEASVSGG